MFVILFVNGDHHDYVLQEIQSRGYTVMVNSRETQSISVRVDEFGNNNTREQLEQDFQRIDGILQIQFTNKFLNVDEIPLTASYKTGEGGRSKKIFGKMYNRFFNYLKGSGLSKYSIILKLHVFLTRQLKSEYVYIYGLKFYLGKNDEARYSLENFHKRYYFDFLEKQIYKDDNVVDVGAKVGIYSLALSKFVDNLGTVFSFEPTPESFEILKKNKQINLLNHLTIRGYA